MKTLPSKLAPPALVLTMLLCAVAQGQQQSPASNAMSPNVMPAIFPAPVSTELRPGAFRLGRAVALTVEPGTDPETVQVIRESLSAAGVEKIGTEQQHASAAGVPRIVIGLGTSPAVKAALSRSGAAADSQPEGYTLASQDDADGALITLAGYDADGLFHAAQTFRQLARLQEFPAILVTDHPAMQIRGTIEGFYGAPWSMEDRAKHLHFLASVKANSYVYSPKDDPYARDRWREPYPAATLAELGKLAQVAQRDHIHFIYAISPGPTVCFSDPADLLAIKRKFQALRSVGTHNFYVALDDIEYTKWNCALDQKSFGEPGAEAAGVAQAQFLNAVQADLDVQDKGSLPLLVVPTEYYNATESPYKAALRKHLNPKIVLQWTGTDVVPPSIGVSDGKAAEKAFGRKVLLWDNYPVNDYKQTAGRLLLAPYTRREAGLSGELTGILSNPMNQEAPSRVAVTGLTGFAWNDKDYDADRTWAYAARALAGYDDRTAKALLIFFDTQHLAPIFGTQPWQQQAPRLKAKLDAVRDAIASGDRADRREALTGLAQFADAFEGAPDAIRAGTLDPSFVQQSGPWLDAMQLWGRALQLTAAGLEAADRNEPAAGRYFARARLLAAEAAQVHSIAGATRFDGPIKLADGVLDKFVEDGPTLILPAR